MDKKTENKIINLLIAGGAFLTTGGTAGAILTDFDKYWSLGAFAGVGVLAFATGVYNKIKNRQITLVTPKRPLHTTTPIKKPQESKASKSIVIYLKDWKAKRLAELEKEKNKEKLAKQGLKMPVSPRETRETRRSR